jgi:putative transposase
MPKSPIKPRIYYHVTFQPYRRLPILYAEIEAYLRIVLPKIAKLGEFTIIEIGVVPTHIHLLIEKAPWANLLQIIHEIQDATSNDILQQFPDLNWDYQLERFWADGYHYVRHTEKSLETVKRYIRNQKKHHGLE